MFQVAEVGTVDRTRFSVNGWFHGPLPECENVIPNVHIDIHLFSPIQVTCLILLKHMSFELNPIYSYQIILL
jgi:hypothetical protein